MKTNLWLILAFALFTNAFAQNASNPTAAAPTKTTEPLAQSTLDKIAAMTSIFDGKTLDGWIQSPINYNLSSGDISNMSAFAKKLADKTDGVSAFLNEQLDDSTKSSLAGLSSGTTTNVKAAISTLLKGLNKAVNGPSIYDEKRFTSIQLSPDTKELLQQRPIGAQLAHLNRLLLEDAYPLDIAKSQKTSWVVKDGAMTSTGAGRGVIYTKSDYTNYRIIFNMREISGNHQPCVLLFCTRPAAEKGLDALGGIQFQAPNGGHWDYRPGFNKGGDGFKNPIKTKYNNHEWSQVEILVNAKNGTARMAVAQPSGTKGIENLDYSNPEAGKTGPFALQMHNGGLFDEYKDLRIEIDPKEDKLITAE